MTQLRADAQRNLDRLLVAAGEAFAEAGADATVDEIARRAGVGHGTVFRRFPTKHALIAAVVAARMRELVQVAESALADEDAGAAFRSFVWQVAERHARDRRLLECFDRCGEVPEKEELHRLGAQIVERAQAAGAVRGDVSTLDVELLLSSVLRAAPPDHWRRHVDVVLDGLRPTSA